MPGLGAPQTTGKDVVWRDDGRGRGGRAWEWVTFFFWVGDGGEKGREARGKVGRNADRSVSQTYRQDWNRRLAA